MTATGSILSVSTFPANTPALRRETKRYDIVVAGAGLAGIGAAITAARHGAKVALVQDRPVLGGNASKEVRVWPQGASGGANAIYFRETGVMEELLLENQFRNPQGTAEYWDTVLLDAVLAQKNLDLYLNASIFDVVCDGQQAIRSVTALTLHAETLTTFEADYFIDCTGDGTLGYLAGAPYMTGREAQGDFGESLAPPERKPYTLGGSILFLARDTGQPVAFHSPAFAYKFTEKDFRSGRHPVHEFDRFRGLFWWIEWGGTLDTIHDNEAIKIELLKIAYGVFDWLKNDPSQREKNQNMTLEWVGSIPGKRESRRFIGDHVLTESDIVERRDFPDAIAYGGWNLDDHAPKGFFDDEKPASQHTQTPGIYNLPLRSLYSKTVPNLFFAGRNASVTHVALTSTRVMLTGAQMGEAAGAAAWMCIQKKISPRTLATGEAVRELQERLLRDDHYVIGRRSQDPANAAQRSDAKVEASSQCAAVSLEQSDRLFPLDKDRLALFPASAGTLPFVNVLLTASADTTLAWQLHRPDGRGLTIPARAIAEGSVAIKAGGTQWVSIPVAARIESDDFHMLELKRNPLVSWHGAAQRRVGLKSYAETNSHGRNVNRHSRFACMKAGTWSGAEQNYCVRLPDDPRIYAPANVINGFSRPFKGANAWVSKETDFAQPEWLQVGWGKAAPVREIICVFDSNLDRHLTAMWVVAPHTVEPDLVKDYDLELRRGNQWVKVAEGHDNHRRRCVHTLGEPVNADALRLVVKATHGTPRAQVYEVRVY